MSSLRGRTAGTRRRWPRAVFFAVVLVAGLAVWSGMSGASVVSRRHVAHTAQTAPPIQAQLPCSSLVQNGFASTAGVPDFEDIPGAPTRIESATPVAATSTTPAYCDVQGYILDQINFDLKLPTSTWQGRYLQLGCGGFCGTITPSSSVFGSTFPACDANLGGDFAISATDDGHEGAGTDALWAGNDTQLRIDFGYRAVHLTAVASKAIIAAYYGTPVKQSYFDGCSDGGREGLMEAQRYPADFNGIIAGAPANLMSTDPLWLAYMEDANTDSQGNPILTADKLTPLHNAVMAQCGDGLGDGFIAGDPRDCHFDPASIECHGADGPNCLTASQVTVVDDIYRGVVVNGVRLDPRMVPYGSELSWAGWWVPAAGSTSPPTAEIFGQNAARYLSYPIGEGKPLGKVKFTPHEFYELAQSAKYYEALNPNLKAFRAHGGKLIMYGGWADTLVPPVQTLDYYAAVRREMGGLTKTQQFARLFMITGMGHCGAFGPTPNQSTMLNQLVDWVEQGQAPSSITISEASGAAGQPLTRPVYPYPLQAKYVGPSPSTDPTGPDQAGNFVPAQPTVRHDDNISWIGAFYLRPRPPSSSGA